MLEAEKHLNDKRVYEEVKFDENILTGLVENSDTSFNYLYIHRLISESLLKYFPYNFKKASNLYFLLKIHKRLANVPGKPVISNCGTPTEKVSEFLDFLLKPVMQDRWSYIKDTGDFLQKIKHLSKILKGAILLTADIVELYPNIPHGLGLQSLKKRLNETGICKVPTEEIISMAEFVLKNNYFEFNEKVCKPISETATGTKFAPPYTCIFMDEIKTSFLKTQKLQPFTRLRNIDDIFFILTHGEEQHNLFLKDLNEFHPNVKFTHEPSHSSVTFLDLNVSLKDGAISLCYILTPQIFTSSYIINHLILPTRNSIPYSQAFRISTLCSS